jgi:hypothetical protein
VLINHFYMGGTRLNLLKSRAGALTLMLVFLAGCSGSSVPVASQTVPLNRIVKHADGNGADFYINGRLVDSNHFNKDGTVTHHLSTGATVVDELPKIVVGAQPLVKMEHAEQCQVDMDNLDAAESNYDSAEFALIAGAGLTIFLDVETLGLAQVAGLTVGQVELASVFVGTQKGLKAAQAQAQGDGCR